MYNYYFLIPLISFFISNLFVETLDEELNPPAECYLPSHPSVQYSCLDVEGSRECSQYEVNGTLVSPQCRSPNYYSATVLTYMLCIDGNWNYTAKCSLDCGSISAVGDPLVIGGVSAKRAEVPWHAGIYTTTTRPYSQICGGSVISNNIVLSAAHCFWSDFDNKAIPAVNFAVAVGKVYRPWKLEDDAAQRSDVKDIHLPILFQGSMASYQEDIAVVVVKMPFQFTPFVRPVCVNFDKALQEEQLQVGNTGQFAGWGLTGENGPASQVLKNIGLPVVTIEMCIQSSPQEFLGYITSDKICAGFVNERKGICRGDSGGGLAIPKMENGIPRFYLRGIASTAPTTSNQSCNVNFYTTFTQILSHKDFIKKFFASGEPCRLKPHYSVEYRCFAFGSAQTYRRCAAYEVTGAVVSPRCRRGYYSLAALSFMNCAEGTWNYIAKCIQEIYCKEVSLGGNHLASRLYPIDNKTLKYVTEKRDSAGLLSYFEMHFAVKSDESVDISVLDKQLQPDFQYFIGIGYDGNQYTDLYNAQWTKVRHVHTPDILSTTQFRAFYIKIYDGKVEFGKEGDTSPIISYEDASFKLVNFFKFYYAEDETANIRLDCPDPGLGRT